MESKNGKKQAHLGEIFVFWDDNEEKNESPAAATRGTRIYGQVVRYVWYRNEALLD